MTRQQQDDEEMNRGDKQTKNRPDHKNFQLYKTTRELYTKYR